MSKFNIYPKLILLVSFVVIGYGSAFSQLEFKLQLMNDSIWGVYVRPDNTITPSTTTTTGSGQVTLVAPTGFVYSNLVSVSGTWSENARVNAPPENTARDYISFGWLSDTPPIVIQAGTETLLFKFKKVQTCPDTLYLIENGVDPFDQLPNSANNNPGNNLSMIDLGVPGNPYYDWSANYAFAAWSCHDCDGDGILNALEDTNGNGIFDDLEDISNLCDPCDPFHVETATLDYVGQDSICAGDATDTAYLIVNIVGGWVPYTVIYSDGSQQDTVTNFLSGDSIAVVPSVTTTYSLVTVIDSFLCEINPDSLNGTIPITVEGPLSISDHPDDVTECSGDGTSFSAVAVNGGGGNINYQWQISTDGGSTWSDIVNGTPYSTALTNTLNISNVAGLHNRRYRLKISTPHCNPVYSNSALLQVEGPITVTTHPSNKTICAGSNTTFTGAGNNAGAVGTLAYQWQVSTDGGSTWSNVSNGGVYSNATTATLGITAAPVSMDGYQYRLAISTGTCSAIYTNAAILDIEGPLTFTSHPADVSNCAGNEVFFNYQYTNPGGGTVTFQWQQSCDGGSTWTNLPNANPYNNTNGTSLGVTGDTLAITNVIGLDGCMYRVRINTGQCSVVTSNAATLNVSGNVTFSDHPDDITVCSGSDTMFVAAASIPQGTFTYGWQVSTNGGSTWSAITLPGGVYTHSTGGSVASGNDTLFISNVAGLNNNRYRAVAFSANCDSVVSNEARLLVEGPLSVTAHPSSVTECSGNAVTFSATIDNPGLANSTVYRWQVSTDNGVTWTNLFNGGVYNGTSTATLSISNVAGLYNYQYRLSAGTSTCNIIFTNAATLTVEGPVTVTDQPDNYTTCSGNAASFSATVTNSGAGTMTHQWQVSTDGGTNYSNISNGAVYSGATTLTLNISDVTGLDGRCYRLRTTTGECAEVYTLKACLAVEGPISLDADVQDTIIQCSGSPVLFTVSTSLTGSGTLQYQWQQSTNDGSTWTNLTDGNIYNGVNTDTMSISNTTGMANNLYQVLIWTGTCDTVVSSQSRLLIEGPITVVDEPDNIIECSGSGVTFQATISNAGLGTLLYQWQRSCDGGTTWTDVSNGGANGYSGATTSSLVITDVVGLDSCRFRLRYSTTTCGAAFTNYAALTVEGPIDFVIQPVPATVCSGGTANFFVTTENTGSGQITYQWQTSVDTGATWVNISNNSVYNGTTSSNLSVVVAGLNGRCFRVLIQTSTCESVASDMACLTVEGPISFTDHPDDVTQCSGESVQFIGSAGIAVGNSGTITYQWQVSSDNGVNWSNLTDVSPYSGATNDTLSISSVAGLNNRRYRLRATTTACNTGVYSNIAKLTVEGPLSVTAHPSDVTNCSDKEALFFGKVTNPGQGTTIYQWQQSLDGGTTWTNMTNGSVDSINYGGVNTDTLLIAPLTGLAGSMYRLQAWTGTCDTVITNSATLNVDGPLTITDEPDDVTLCSTSPTSFTIAASNPGSGTIQYQWQMSTNGFTWNNLSNTAPYSGVTTNTLNISNTAGLGGRKYRCRVRTGNCDWTPSVHATLFVEGPITISLEPADASVCSNIGHTFNTTVSNPGSGVLQLQWQVSSNGGASWANLSNGAIGNGGTYLGTKTEDLNISLVTGLTGYKYRLLLRTSTCFDTTNVATLTVLDACTTGTCDFDLDGIDNNTDDDDDNDQLTDYWEDWMTAHNTLDGWNYLDSNGDTLFYSNCDTDTDDDTILDNQEDPDGDNINNGEETDGDLIFDGNPLDPCDPILGPTCKGINLAIRVYLQGAMIGVSASDTLMRDDLRKGNIAADTTYLPLEEPYTDLANFTHVAGGGGETIADSAAVLGVTGEEAIVDWVFIELRNSSDLEEVIATRSALLQRDGDVVDVDGSSVLHFDTTNAGAYYVVVRHRNHLGIMTAEALDLSPVVQEVDFTDPAFPTNGVYAQINLNGRMAMWAGDLNFDGRSIYQGPGNDVIKLFNTVLTDPNNTNLLANYITAGYLTADIDLNGRAIYQGPLNDRNMVLFNVILNYPANGSNLANYAILEQLP